MPGCPNGATINVGSEGLVQLLDPASLPGEVADLLRQVLPLELASYYLGPVDVESI